MRSIRQEEQRGHVSRNPCRSCVFASLQLTREQSLVRHFDQAPKIQWPVPQAATLVGLTSRSLLELVIGIDRGFIASGISRTRSTCRSPFSRLAPLTLT